MTEPFSHEDWMEGGQNVMSLWEALEDDDVQARLLDVRHAMLHARDALAAQGLNGRVIAQTLLGTAFGVLLPEDDA